LLPEGRPLVELGRPRVRALGGAPADADALRDHLRRADGWAPAHAARALRSPHVPRLPEPRRRLHHVEPRRRVPADEVRASRAILAAALVAVVAPAACYSYDDR